MNDDAVKNLDCRNGWFYCDFVDPSGRRIRKALKTRNEKIARQRLMKMQTEAYELAPKHKIQAIKTLEIYLERNLCHKNDTNEDTETFGKIEPENILENKELTNMRA